MNGYIIFKLDNTLMCVMSPPQRQPVSPCVKKCSPVSFFKRTHLVPVFNRNLSMNDPQTKFEVNWSKCSRLMAQKPFSDGATWWPSKFEVNQSVIELSHGNRFQVAPPGGGASFWKEPSSDHEWSTEQIWSESVKAFLSYRTETVFRWCHLVAQGGTTWCQFSKGTFLCPWVIYRPNLKWIGPSVLEGTTWWQFSKGTFLCPWMIHRPNLKWISQSVLELLHGSRFQMAPPGASFRKEPSSIHEWSKEQIWSESFQAFSSHRT